MDLFSSGSPVTTVQVAIHHPNINIIKQERDSVATILISVFFYQGDTKREFNPTFYRTDAQYSHLVSSIDVVEPEGGQKFGYDIVLKKKVQAYIEVKFWVMTIILRVMVSQKYHGSTFPDEKQPKPDLLAAGEGSPLFRLPERIQHLPAVPG